MKKRFLCTLLAGMMVLSLTACGGKKEENNATNPTTQPTEAPANPTEKPADPTDAPTEAPAEPTDAPEETPAADFSVVELMNSVITTAGANLPGMMQGGEMELTELYTIDAAAVTEYGIYIPMMMVHATELAIFKAAGEENVQAVVDGINHRVEYLTDMWSTYLPDQFELVENHKVVTQGEYVLFIVAEPEVAAYVENVFMRQFDPSLEEVVLLRKFDQVDGTLTELTDSSLKLELVDGKTYQFDCTFADYIYIEGDIAEFAVGDKVTVAFEAPVTESEEPMQAVLTYLAKYVEY
ncbi:MAG: DUF4358 domain-containing protein [Lachnospiraceae bacterium]|nr:DUF4358 domain-containing protein [Lachnospiraceae bacterium]